LIFSSSHKFDIMSQPFIGLNKSVLSTKSAGSMLLALTGPALKMINLNNTKNPASNFLIFISSYYERRI
jgi:hypothetical protein